MWWARTIRRANLVDPELVAAQGHRGSERSAVRRYVRGGFRTGFSLNPLIMERLVASQLSDVGRVPALYAYLVNDARRLELSINWDSRTYSLQPTVLTAPGGPLGHAWRTAIDTGEIELRGSRVRWVDFTRAVCAAAARAAGTAVEALHPIDSTTVFVCRIEAEEDCSDALRLVATFAGTETPVVIALRGADANQWISAAQVGLRFRARDLEGYGAVFAASRRGPNRLRSDSAARSRRSNSARTRISSIPEALPGCRLSRAQARHPEERKSHA